MTKILGLIPARGGSKGIPNKNIIDLNGKPLINYTIEAALECQQLTNLIISSDNQDIIDVACTAGAEAPFIRPSQFSGDRSGAVEVIQHAIDHYAQTDQYFDLIVYLQPTSPLRSAYDIQSAIQKIINTDADSLVSVMNVPHQFGIESLMVEKNELVSSYMKSEARYTRQEKINYVARNGPAIVITRPNTIKKFNTLYGENILSYKMPNNRSVDIDSIEDLDYASYLLEKNT